MVTVDLCKKGLGFFLKQKKYSCSLEDAPHCGPDHWQLILAGSRVTNDAESCYIPVEGEALALAFGLESTRMYALRDPHLLVGTDHKPLVQIMTLQKKLEDIKNPRLRVLKIWTLMRSFSISHILGEKNVGPDVMSRTLGQCSAMKAECLDMLQLLAMDNEPDDMSSYDPDDVVSVCSVCTCVMADEFRAMTWDRVKTAAAEDEQCARLQRYISIRFLANRPDMSGDIRNLWHLRDDLYLVEGVPMVNGRIFIPFGLRRES